MRPHGPLGTLDYLIDDLDFFRVRLLFRGPGIMDLIAPMGGASLVALPLEVDTIADAKGWPKALVETAAVDLEALFALLIRQSDSERSP